ncbi:DUF2812 domain-containing protein [Paenibacillus sepulcri]|uniref:DUF2812 domain-containing protein n=1 Tax=Paenibacillus sepulcri TaxID=359917 RepID=A0ABS7C124_9BACL|nr:DUF2812 domain-containing protein [Paenibacillus sepulcri]
MSKRYKYMASGGLAFTEERDMDRLSRLAAKGWILESFAFLGYRLRRSEPQQLTYCVDYNQVNERDMTDYVELFEAGGWHKVCSSERIHIFSARKGTAPIYTDNDTHYEKYNSSVKMMRPLLLAPVLTLVLLALLLFVPSIDEAAVALAKTLRVLIALGAVISIPVLMTYTSLMIRLRRVNRT